MTDSHHTETPVASRDWPLRPLVLALLGLAAGLVVHLIIGAAHDYQLSAAKLSLLAFVTVFAGLVGFTIERRWWWASIAFAAAMGVIAAGVVWWNGGPAGWSGGDGWRAVSLLLAIAIAAPLFQAARDEGAARFPYRSVHDHAWTNVVLWGACCVFVGISFALAFLLAGLFDLIKLGFLSELLRENWFWRALVGLAFGGALGLLREHDAVVRLLQRVVLTVLAVLAPVLAVGLIGFVLALPFTGLAPLWEAGSATAILLACIVGALILANSVIGNAPDEERRAPLLRFGAMGLGLVMLPLGVIAAIAIGLRIGQYGFTPERLWALTFVILACAYGLAYLVSLLLGRLDWSLRLRPANLNLAFATCAVALLLATPLVSFNAISTRDQVARLESGRLSPEKFDWRALAFEFGAPGKAALKRLQMSANAEIRQRAVQAAKAENRWDVPNDDNASREKQARRAEVSKMIRVLPAGKTLPEALRDAIADDYVCRPGRTCTLFMVSDTEALLFDNGCFEVESATGVSTTSLGCANPDRFGLEQHKWEKSSSPSSEPDARQKAVIREALDTGAVEIRTVPRRQAFVGGVPVGEPFE